ncbi:MAG: MBOAT family O-acyltransferase, partial [Traorella sp.]
MLIKKTNKWHKMFLIIPIIINVGLLLYFKYLNFAISNINLLFTKDYALRELVLPLGISFFTFQQIAYIVAIYKKELSDCSLIDYLAYILYFPKILMGPLMDPIDFMEQLNDQDNKKLDWDNIASGIKIFSFGLFKKVMIADVFSSAVSWGFTNWQIASSLDLLLVSLFYTFEIYFDFSGYSDMAVGASILFNIKLPINFDSPYKALSIRDFWKRWHISLTKFFTKYIYIPLGGSRKGKILTYVNTLIVFGISGLWHGANWTFILWGILHGLLMILDRVFEKVEEKIFEPARWVMTFCTVNLLWLLFRADSIFQWIEILKKIICMNSTSISYGLVNSFILPESTFLYNVLHISRLVISVRGFWMGLYILLAFGICMIPENNYRTLKKLSIGYLILAFVAFVWGFICLSSESVFVYFNF